MTKLRLEDLPPKVREQIQASNPELGKLAGKSKSQAKSRKGISNKVPAPGTCHACGQEFPNPDIWERHVDAVHGGARFDIDLSAVV